MAILKVAKVAVDNATYHFDKMFDYGIPVEFAENVMPGVRVLVPFGKGNRKRVGMVFDVADVSELDKIKPITSVIDNETVLTFEQLMLAHWIKERTFCTFYDVVKLMLPSGINYQVFECYSVYENYGALLDDLSDEERRVVGYIAKCRDSVSQKKLSEVFGLSANNQMLGRLVEKGVIYKNDEAIRNSADKTVKMVRICSEYDDGEAMPALTPKQKGIVDILNDVKTANVREICYFAGVTQAVLDALVKKNVVEYYEREVLRNPYKSDGIKSIGTDDIILTVEQQNALDGLVGDFKSNQFKVALLYGITGSGKTQIYLKLIDEVIKSGKQVIFMVPEISLTPQTVSKFQRCFGDKVAVLHSGLSVGERMDEWKRLREKKAYIAVGTRSAVFAPLDDIGLIIMDEEQEHTYKSESSPRFHAREVAKFRCYKNNALLLLASATPLLETYYNAKSEKYSLYRLENRYGAATLPEVIIVDMKDELVNGNDSSFSSILLSEIEKNLDNNEQSILLYNRRGYNTMVTCCDCGYVFTCPNCSISMTYHRKNGMLMCHYCGHCVELPDACDKCGGKKLKHSGMGTQRVEDEIGELFKSARVLRMDMDTTMSRYSYEKYFNAFANHEYDIMIGTQMVAKGLDFPDVTLVGVLSADQTLYANDYKSFERAFSLITQVVGRSGRGDKKGRAIIQTFTPQNPIISLAATQNYDEFYVQEIENRRLLTYPPFCDICIVAFSAEDESEVKLGSKIFFELLKKKISGDYSRLPIKVMGPLPFTVVKVSNKYRYKLIIKCKNTSLLRNFISELIYEYYGEGISKKCTVFADMNYEGTL